MINYLWRLFSDHRSAAAPADCTLPCRPRYSDTILATAAMQAVIVLFCLPLTAGAQVFASKNWGGYAAETNFTTPVSDSVSAVGGSWTVPLTTASANTASHFTAAVQWVGIDGYVADLATLEQIGTECTIQGSGKASYTAWFEMVPLGFGLTTITKDNNGAAFTVSPGDSITASVQYSPTGHPGQFALSITDSTSGHTFTTYQTNNNAMRESAEWIVEAPTVSSTIVPLPTIGSVPFTDDWATIDSSTGVPTTGPIDDPAWQTTQVNLSPSISAWGDSLTPGAVTDVGSGTSAESSFTVIQAPEPSTLAYLVAAAGALAVRALAARRRQNSQRALRLTMLR